MIEQFSLLPEIEEELEKEGLEELKENICDYRRRSNAVIAEVTAYVIVDQKNRKTYVGHTMEPDIRIAYHLAGKTNSSLIKITKTRPNDLSELCRFKFTDPNYSHSENSLAKWVEAFLVAYYDSLDCGYNTQFNYDHDFKDIDFWASKLKGELFGMYEDSDHDLLNQRVENHISYNRQEYKKSRNTVDRLAKELLRKQLDMYHAMPIKYSTIIKDSKIVNLGNVYKFRKGADTVLGVERIYTLIKHFEQVLEREVKFDLDAEVLKNLQDKFREESANV
jgi:hypothetical protein